MTQMIATRAAGQARLEQFSARMGRDYAQGRNFDRGSGSHRDVSMLSAYIRRRLLTEQEVIAAAIKAQGAEASAKFIDEVIWRSYFKGWLEQRPGIWDSYAAGLRQDLAALDGDAGLRHAVQAAETAQTGLAYFDSWAAELIETGYLHNHARMWFASIWIFTLKLPWRLGADFFLRNLLDGDPASNTLSWRWVAGLHTRGKPYVAQAGNIARFTEERLTPRAEELAQTVSGLEHLEPGGLPECKKPRIPKVPQKHLPTAFLLTEEDCRIEDFAVQELMCTTAATLARAACVRLVMSRRMWCSLRWGFGRCGAKIGPSGRSDAGWHAVRSCKMGAAIGGAANCHALCARWPVTRLASARQARARRSGRFPDRMAPRVGRNDLALCNCGVF